MPKFLKVLETVVGSILAVMAALVVYQVVGRYLLGQPPSWTEEMARYLQATGVPGFMKELPRSRRRARFHTDGLCGKPFPPLECLSSCSVGSFSAFLLPPRRRVWRWFMV